MEGRTCAENICWKCCTCSPTVVSSNIDYFSFVHPKNNCPIHIDLQPFTNPHKAVGHIVLCHPSGKLLVALMQFSAKFDLDFPPRATVEYNYGQILCTAYVASMHFHLVRDVYM